MKETKEASSIGPLYGYFFMPTGGVGGVVGGGISGGLGWGLIAK